MKKFLVLCKETSQSLAFKRMVMEYTKANNFSIEWFFCDHLRYHDVLEKGDIDLVLISPEVILYEKQISNDLRAREVQFLIMKPIDFGLKRMEKLFPTLSQYLK